MSAPPSVSIEPTSPEHADELFVFEVENREFFEQWIAGRGDDYYSVENVRQSLSRADDDRDGDRAYHYLVRAQDVLIGRVNLWAVERGHVDHTSVGYRIGGRYGGRGYASEAVRLALIEAFGSLGLWRVEAAVTADNAASQSVLRRNGFRRYGHSTRSVYLRGVWCDLFHYEHHRDDDAEQSPDPTAEVGQSNDS